MTPFQQHFIDALVPHYRIALRDGQTAGVYYNLQKAERRGVNFSFTPSPDQDIQAFDANPATIEYCPFAIRGDLRAGKICLSDVEICWQLTFRIPAASDISLDSLSKCRLKPTRIIERRNDLYVQYDMRHGIIVGKSRYSENDLPVLNVRQYFCLYGSIARELGAIADMQTWGQWTPLPEQNEIVFDSDEPLCLEECFLSTASAPQLVAPGRAKLRLLT